MDLSLIVQKKITVNNINICTYCPIHSLAFNKYKRSERFDKTLRSLGRSFGMRAADDDFTPVLTGRSERKGQREMVELIFVLLIF
jgi:hypothetical protein